MAAQKVSYVHSLQRCGQCGLPQLPSEGDSENQESSESGSPSASVSTSPAPAPRKTNADTPVRKPTNNDGLRNSTKQGRSKASPGKEVNKRHRDKEAPKKVDKGKKPAKKQPLDSSEDKSSPLIPKRPAPAKQEAKSKPKPHPRKNKKE